MPAPLLDRDDLATIARRHVDGDSDATIARLLGVERSTVRKARARTACVEMIEVERRRKSDRERQAKHRANERREEAERVAAVESAGPRSRESILAEHRITRDETGAVVRIAGRGVYDDLYLNESRQLWMHEATVGFDRPARASDFEKLGVPVPASFNSELKYGPPIPGMEREALGTVQRMVRMVEHKDGPYGPLAIKHPVPEKDVPEKLKLGNWTLADA